MLIPTPKCRFNLCLGLGKCECGRSKITFVRSLEALEGTFIRVHIIGSVLSGLEAGNVNSDRKMPNQECERVHCRGQNDVFLKLGDLEGNFYKETHEAKLFGIHIGSLQWVGSRKCQ